MEKKNQCDAKSKTIHVWPDPSWSSFFFIGDKRPIVSNVIVLLCNLSDFIDRNVLRPHKKRTMY